MGRKNLNDLPDYSQRIKEKRPAPNAPRPSLSEENQLELAKRWSILDQGVAMLSRRVRPVFWVLTQRRKRRDKPPRRASTSEEKETLALGPASKLLIFPLSILEQRLSPRLFLRSRAERDLFHLARSVRILRSKLGSIIVGASVIWKGTFPLYQPRMLVRREMGSGPGSFPQVESLREREAYENACRKSCEVNF